MTAECASSLRSICNCPGQRSKRRPAICNSGSTNSRLKNLIKVGQHESLQEIMHMQPQLKELLRGIHALKPAAVQIYDTHSHDPIQQPAGLVDCSLLASDLR